MARYVYMTHADLYTRQVLCDEACDVLNFPRIDAMPQALKGLEVDT